ncbi:hypothetical protein LTS10_013207 [Elasticomyces elasticus]|nr:hypothetical protein LTS10_013207 [Elasticomyces elasticus]
MERQGQEWRDATLTCEEPSSHVVATPYEFTSLKHSSEGSLQAYELLGLERKEIEQKTSQVRAGSPLLIDMAEEDAQPGTGTQAANANQRAAPIASNPLSSSSGSLAGEADPFDLSALLRENADLKTQNKQLLVKLGNMDELGRWPVLHRIDCPYEDDMRTYSDRPVSIDTGGHDHIDSFRRVPDEEAWEKSQNAPFVVYKIYNCSTKSSGNAKVPSGTTKPPPKSDFEEVHILNDSLRDALGQLFKSHQGLRAYFDQGVFEDETLHAPYLFHYHFESQIQTFTECSGLDQQPLKLLFDYIKSQSASKTAEADELFARGVVTSDLMRHLFTPSELLVTSQEGAQVVMSQSSPICGTPQSDSRKEGWSCETTSISFNGKFHLQKHTVLVIISADKANPVSITSLSDPLSHAGTDLHQTLVERGKTFFDCREQRYVTSTANEFGGRNRLIEERYMVDVEIYHRLHGGGEQPREDSGIEPTSDDESFIIQLPAKILGFRMSDKTWVNLPVADIHSVTWNKRAFEDLVIHNDENSDTKELIQALIQNKIQADQSIDFVEGKGTGLVLLLHGYNNPLCL